MNPETVPEGSARLGTIDRMARSALMSGVSKLERGEITLRDASGSTTVGEPDDLHATVTVNHPRFYRDAVLGGTLSVAECYLRGDWDCDDLTALFRIFVRNLDAANGLDKGFARLAALGNRAYHAWHANNRSGSRKNIRAHYDLGNDFFRLWLDDTLAYSSGFFATPAAGMREASVEKFDRACRKLDLAPGDRVLEIGTGWGGFALHAAREYGCHVTTTTISREQAVAARQRFEEAGLSHRITLLEQDYRELTGKYDRIISIEMIEAVGYRYFDTFFAKCGDLLEPDGSMLLQAIVLPEYRYDQYLKSVDFIQRYIFPGGCLPSVAALLDSAGRTTSLRLVHVEDFGPHYAETLRRWRAAFRENADEVRRQGYDEAFLRMWDYYLCYCEALFEERSGGVAHILFDGPRCRRDPGLVARWAAGERRNPAAELGAGEDRPTRREPSWVS